MFFSPLSDSFPHLLICEMDSVLKTPTGGREYDQRPVGTGGGSLLCHSCYYLSAQGTGEMSRGSGMGQEL